MPILTSYVLHDFKRALIKPLPKQPALDPGVLANCRQQLHKMIIVYFRFFCQALERIIAWRQKKLQIATDEGFVTVIVLWS